MTDERVVTLDPLPGFIVARLEPVPTPVLVDRHSVLQQCPTCSRDVVLDRVAWDPKANVIGDAGGHVYELAWHPWGPEACMLCPRTVRLLAALRLIVVEHQAVHDLARTIMSRGQAPCECEVMLSLAWSWSDHSDWHEEWRIG